MTNTPIYRIPLEGMTEMQLINAEAPGEGGPFGDIEFELTALLDHCDKEDALSVTLDWAMQLRDKTGMDWGTCIRVASISYFG